MQIIPIFDGHNDTLYHLFLPEKSKGRSFFEESTHGHLDLPRAKKGGVIGGFFAIYTPPPKSSPERNPQYRANMTAKGYNVPPRKALEYHYASEFTNAVIDFAYQLEEQSQGKVKIIQTYQEIIGCIDHAILAIVLHIEGAAAIKEDLSGLKRYYHRGLRSLGLVWSRPNAFGYGVPFQYPHSPDIGPGLTESGKKLVVACNELGIVIDLAHLNEKGFWDVAKLTKHPLIVSHTGAYALSPSSRNLTDEQIDAVGKSGGVIGIMFQPTHLKFKVNNTDTLNNNISLVEIVKHIDYIAKRIGIDHVALGSDFDGAEMPFDLKDASGLPKLVNALREKGYEDTAIEQIGYKNWLRLLKTTWEK